MGGWVWPNAYVCLHSGWVGLVKCLRNQKSNTAFPENGENLINLYPKTNIKFYYFFSSSSRDKTVQILKFIYLLESVYFKKPVARI